jgi:hypothetical protein
LPFIQFCLGKGVAAIEGETASAKQLRVDRYLLARLGIGEKEPVPVLDALPLDEVVDVLNRVGAFVEGGYSEKWQTAAGLGKEGSELRALGFHVLANRSLPFYLERSFDTFMRNSKKEPNLTSVFGWFYHWLNGKGNGKFSPILSEVVLSAADRLLPAASRLRMKDVDIHDTYCTLEEAARECRQGKTTMRRILKQFGRDRSLNRQGIPFRIERKFVPELRDVLLDKCTLSEVNKILGTSHDTTKYIIDAGSFVQPLEVAESVMHMPSGARISRRLSTASEKKCRYWKPAHQMPSHYKKLRAPILRRSIKCAKRY